VEAVLLGRAGGGGAQAAAAREGLATLDEAQQAVVDAPDGPTLVLAGAGSGKTRALVHRVARLVGSGVAPSRILLGTFTNRAARELSARGW
jgi:DNA helicase-2/ATP-dependent DNA helicase PcrA